MYFFILYIEGKENCKSRGTVSRAPNYATRGETAVPLLRETSQT